MKVVPVFFFILKIKIEPDCVIILYTDVSDNELHYLKKITSKQISVLIEIKITF